jgi:hypothetical protein
LSKKNRFQKGGFVDTKQAPERAVQIGVAIADSVPIPGTNPVQHRVLMQLQPETKQVPASTIVDGPATAHNLIGIAETDFGISEPVLFPYKKQPVKKCLSCRYARRLEAEQHKARCHRHPPVLVVDNKAMAGTSTPLVDGWPIVLVDDFCGEHTA